MGTTLANIHVMDVTDSEERQLLSLLPNAAAGRWSERFISLYSEEFTLESVGKIAKTLSKKLVCPVLLVWIFDSDAVGFTVYLNGKTIAEHILSPEGFGKMGNIPLFCDVLGLPAEDAARLRSVWKKGGAEEQLELTAMLLGLPLNNDCRILPDKQYFRDSETVDKWIAERPAPASVKSETKAIIIQELKQYRRYYYPDEQYCSAEPYNDTYGYSKIQFWTINADGTFAPGWSTNQFYEFRAPPGRILAFNIKAGAGVIAFDTSRLLPDGYETMGSPIFLTDGGILWHNTRYNGSETIASYIRCTPDGAELWRKQGKSNDCGFFGFGNNEVLFTSIDAMSESIERVDLTTGETLDKLKCPFGINATSNVFNNGYWWIAHDGITRKDGERENRGYMLTKYNGALQTVAEYPLPFFTQTLYFSPDNAYVYIFISKNKIIALNADTLTFVNDLSDKAFLYPLGFDCAGRFWLRRDNSTAEAWDATLSKTLSRHKLKGTIINCHKDERGAMCVATLNEKEYIFRVYKIN